MSMEKLHAFSFKRIAMREAEREIERMKDTGAVRRLSVKTSRSIKGQRNGQGTRRRAEDN